MVRFKNGKMIVNNSDYIHCPFCGVQQRDGKKFRVKMTLESATFMVECGDHQSMPLNVDLLLGTINAPKDREITAYQGPAVILHYLCEDGCNVDQTIAMDKDGNSFTFNERQNEEMEEELNAALEDMEEGEEDEDGES